MVSNQFQLYQNGFRGVVYPYKGVAAITATLKAELNQGADIQRLGHTD